MSAKFVLSIDEDTTWESLMLQAREILNRRRGSHNDIRERLDIPQPVFSLYLHGKRPPLAPRAIAILAEVVREANAQGIIELPAMEPSGEQSTDGAAFMKLAAPAKRASKKPKNQAQ